MVKNTLRKKLLRDMRHSAMQFAALVFLCVLGTLLFTGIDSIANMIALTNHTYFQQNQLADFWITVPQVNRDTLLRVESLPGVKGVTARFALDMEADLPGHPLMHAVGYRGGMDINQPLVREGTLLEESDLRGCLVQAGFADAHGLSVGDRLTLRQNGDEYTFSIRGIVFSPEFVSVSSSGLPAVPDRYGFLLVQAKALPQIPLSQMVVRLEDGANPFAVEEALRDALPRAMVVNREAHQSTVTAEDNVTMFRNISLVFPVAAFGVAALIVMTTLTRMIENQRVQMGTLQSLGYSKAQIRRHYVAYALWPSLVGALLGALLGHWALPSLIWDLLISQYEYPYRLYPHISGAAWLMVVLSVAVSVGICLHFFRKTTKASTAALLRPKPPRAGKRMFLERVPFLWSRFGFNAKMVARNLMRNKMRTVMSCIGILCCNALIIASMGLQDSIKLAADNQYQKTLGYDVLVTLNQQAGDYTAYKTRLEAQGVECIMEQAARVYTAHQERMTHITVVEDEQQMLRLGPDETYVSLVKGGFALTEKLAKTLGLQVGGVFYMQLPGEEEAVCLQVGQVVYNNLSQGVYCTRTTWEALRRGAFTPTHIQLVQPTIDCLAALEAMEEVDKMETAAQRKTELLSALDMVSSVFYILMVIALALAFVICYNMGLINFAERTREYATLKVLGYHQKEIRKLILTENTIIAVLAIALSIYPGIGFTGVILSVVETESTLYAAYVQPVSIAVSSAITFLFSYFIQRLLVRKVQTIDMVEALKSVE